MEEKADALVGEGGNNEGGARQPGLGPPQSRRNRQNQKWNKIYKRNKVNKNEINCRQLRIITGFNS